MELHNYKKIFNKWPHISVQEPPSHTHFCLTTPTYLFLQACCSNLTPIAEINSRALHFDQRYFIIIII